MFGYKLTKEIELKDFQRIKCAFNRFLDYYWLSEFTFMEPFWDYVVKNQNLCGINVVRDEVREEFKKYIKNKKADNKNLKNEIERLKNENEKLLEVIQLKKIDSRN